MNKKGFFVKFILFFVIFLITIIGVLIFYSAKTVIGFTEYSVDYSIGDYIGFNLDSDGIHFGTVTTDFSEKRSLVISTDRDANVRIYVYDLEGVTVDENKFFLGQGEEKTVNLLLNVPLNAEMGTYAGKIMVIYRKPW